MATLRKRLEQQEYDQMISNVKPRTKTPLFSDNDYSAGDAKIMRNQLSAIVNILFSMASVFVAMFIWMKNSPDHLVYSSGATYK